MNNVMRHALKINSQPQSLYLVEQLIEEVCDTHKVKEDCYGNILIALTEAVNNAIQHGNKSNPNKFVSIDFENENNVLIFSVCDEGSGFDPLILPDPTNPLNIEKLSGRGVFLMTQLSDSIRFEENGRKVFLGFNA
jgi:serine/threonine-protein kinase RsbW